MQAHACVWPLTCFYPEQEPHHAHVVPARSESWKRPSLLMAAPAPVAPVCHHHRCHLCFGNCGEHRHFQRHGRPGAAASGGSAAEPRGQRCGTMGRQRRVTGQPGRLPRLRRAEPQFRRSGGTHAGLYGPDAGWAIGTRAGHADHGESVCRVSHAAAAWPAVRRQRGSARPRRRGRAHARFLAVALWRERRRARPGHRAGRAPVQHHRRDAAELRWCRQWRSVPAFGGDSGAGERSPATQLHDGRQTAGGQLRGNRECGAERNRVRACTPVSTHE